MSREIKFRAWVPTNNGEMMKVEEIEWNEDGSIKEIDTGYNFSDKYNPEQLNDVILMQFTGLFDKNEKEIYEGDILNVNSNAVVEWNYELVGFITSNRDPEKPFYNILWASLVREGLAEVIGNIYENSDLL